MSEIRRIIQKQIPIGNRASFVLKNGRELSGMLLELGLQHITLQNDNEIITILIETIGAWQILSDLPNQIQEVAPTSDKEPFHVSMSNESISTMLPEQSTVTSASSTSDVLKKLLEIEARFQVRSQTAVIQPREPDFVFPTNELKGKHAADVSGIWNRIRDKYRYAEKINELSAKFGRVQPLIIELKNLAERFQKSPAIKRHLAYLYWLQGNRLEATNLYKETALTSGDVWDWYNVAALAITCQQEEMACYSLGRFFEKIPITEEMDAWYLHVGLLKKHENYRNLNTLILNKSRALSDEEIGIMLETGIYLLCIVGHNQLATKYLLKKSGLDVKS